MTDAKQIYQFPPILIISEFCASKQVANLCFEHIIIVFFFEQIRGGEVPTYYFIDRKSSEPEPLQ